jgi:hypothetical protein
VPFEPGRGAARAGACGFTPDLKWMFFEWTATEGNIYAATIVGR